jgi:uncharacterized protein YfbU (UPF0304 family)
MRSGSYIEAYKKIRHMTKAEKLILENQIVIMKSLRFMGELPNVIKEDLNTQALKARKALIDNK